MTTTPIETIPAVSAAVLPMPDPVLMAAATAPVSSDATCTPIDRPKVDLSTPTVTSPASPVTPNRSAPPIAPSQNDWDELIRLVRCLLEQEETKAPAQPAPVPPVGEHNLVVDGQLTVRSNAGTVVCIPVNAMLPGALSPAGIEAAYMQFETILGQLVTQPANMAFVAYLEKIRSERSREGQSSEQHGAAAPVNKYGPQGFPGKRL